MADAPAAAALQGVCVLELAEGIAAPFAARLLADFGADVIKVEQPGIGDAMRWRSPVGFDDERVTDGLFEYLNWSKKSIELDLAAAESQGVVRRLAERADIVVTGLRPGRMEQWGIGHAALRRCNPKLVVVAVSNFGQEGPYAHYDATDLVLQAMSGLMQFSGSADREPLKRGLRQSLYTAGLTAAYSALAAYTEAASSGEGAFVDISMLECAASECILNQALYAFLGAVQGRRPPVKDPLDGNSLQCADGYVTLQTTPLVPLERLAEVFEEPRLLESEFETKELRGRNAEALEAILVEHLRHRTGRKFFEWASQQGLLAGFVQDARSLLSCPQLEARETYVTLPGAGWRLPASLARLSRTPQRAPAPAPALGQHTLEILTSLDAAPPQPKRLRPRRAAAPGAGGPLSGLRVVDLSVVFAMPYLTALLADLGAEVIKIEAPHRLDQTRIGWGGSFDNDPKDDPWDRSAIFQLLHRGKRGAAFDLNHEEARELVLQLIEQADVVVEAFTPRVMRKWNLAYDQIATAKPDLIMVSNTGYGATGPWSSFRAQGTTLEATMGVFNYTGYRGGLPAKVGQSYPDFVACWSGLVALMAALVHRDATGEGQHVDLGMYQLGGIVMPEALLHFQAHGDELQRANEDLDALFSAVVPAEGHDRWLALSAGNRSALAALATLVPGVEPFVADRALLIDEESRARAYASVARWSSGLKAADAAAELQAAGVAAGPVNDAREIMLDPQLVAREFHEPACVEHGVGLRRIIGRPYRWQSAGTPPRVRGAAPNLGEANHYVLGELLGISSTRIAELEERKVVSGTPVPRPFVPPLSYDVQLATGELRFVDPDFREVAGPIAAQIPP
jgi:crotonobetainyl-CoA:carnitine CoA-transferase CaiB-like acyl-CoA transferase